MTPMYQFDFSTLISSAVILLASVVAVCLAAWAAWQVIKKARNWIAAAFFQRRFDKVYAKFQAGEKLSDKESDILWQGSEPV